MTLAVVQSVSLFFIRHCNKDDVGKPGLELLPQTESTESAEPESTAIQDHPTLNNRNAVLLSTTTTTAESSAAAAAARSPHHQLWRTAAAAAAATESLSAVQHLVGNLSRPVS